MLYMYSSSLPSKDGFGLILAPSRAFFPIKSARPSLLLLLPSRLHNNGGRLCLTLTQLRREEAVQRTTALKATSKMASKTSTHTYYSTTMYSDQQHSAEPPAAAPPHQCYVVAEEKTMGRNETSSAASPSITHHDLDTTYFRSLYYYIRGRPKKRKVI